MKLRLGTAIGFAAGYYLGAMAGRERQEQINEFLRKLGQSETVDVAAGKAKAAVDLGVERARETLGGRAKFLRGRWPGDGRPERRQAPSEA